MKKLVSLFISAVLLVSILCVGQVDAEAVTYVGTIDLNSVIVAYLDAGDVYEYNFTATQSGVYAVETNGYTDTYGTLGKYDSNHVWQTYSDDDSGEGRNFNIGFYLQANATAVITVRHYNQTSGTGTFNIHVHRQKANVFTYNYSDGSLNTHPQATVPVSCCSTMGYLSTNFQNSPFYVYTGNCTGNVESNINAEVFMISCHGAAGRATIPVGSDITNENLQDIDSLAMKNTKLALWNCCESAVVNSSSPSPYNISLIQASLVAGAKCAIGWSGSVYSFDLETWTDTFFDYLDDGYTIQESRANAINDFFDPYNNLIGKCIMVGESGRIIDAPAVNIKGNSTGQSTIEELKTQLEEEQKAFVFTAYNYENGMTRYYKTIDGQITNDYYDVYEDAVCKSKASISKSEAESIEDSSHRDYSDVVVDPDISIEVDGVVYDRIVSVDECFMYFKTNGSILPIIVQTTIYENEYGIQECSKKCFDLKNNTELDYVTLVMENGNDSRW